MAVIAVLGAARPVWAAIGMRILLAARPNEPLHEASEALARVTGSP